jgi:hypothetical protein
MMAMFRLHPHRYQLGWLFVGLVTLLTCVPLAAAQQREASAKEATPWTRPHHANDANEFQFAVVGDRAANPREGVFEAALAKLRLLRPEFVLSVGDFIHGYGEGMKPLTDESLVREKRREFDEALKTLPLPFYRVPGNHDINNDLSAGIWKELYGPAYYSFLYRDVLFLCLNSQDGRDYSAGIGKEQITWASDVLAKHVDARWVCLFFHQPLWLEDERRLAAAKAGGGAPQLTGFHEIEKSLEGRNYTVFAGHHHRYGKWVKNGQKYFRLATTGGQSSLRGPESGQFDHVTWVTMTDQGPIVCNLLLDGILDEDAKSNMPE